MLVSPAERPPFTTLGVVSPLPETFGCDFVFLAHGQWVGVQRKEVKDLVASLRDGRVADLFAKSGEIGRTVLLVEGDFDWDRAGNSRVCRGYTRAQWHGIELGMQHAGIWVVRTESVEESAATLVQMETWFTKAEHGSLFREPRSKEPVGVQHWATLGAGPKRAKALYDMFGSPFSWRDDIDEERLRGCAGIGKVLAERIVKAGRNGHVG